VLLDVVFSPTEIALALAAQPGAACAVIDVVRATTTLTVLGEGGAARVLIAEDVAAARRLRAIRPGALLAGEVGGLAPDGFDYGNAPSVLAQTDVQGREIILATTNGTRALVAAQANGASALYAAALRNGSAIAARALTHETCVLICAGLEGRVALDDLYAAGVIAGLTVRLAGEEDVPLMLTEGAVMAMYLAENAGEPLAVLRQSRGGRNTLAIEMAADLGWCAEIDASRVIPQITSLTEDGALICTFIQGDD
jgi:2-phosphosulfolactate phosphatase